MEYRLASTERRESKRMKNIVAAIRDLYTTPTEIPARRWKLPAQILADIGKRLQSRLDVVRFRSVCRAWRYSLPPPTRFPLRVPPPPGAELGDNYPYFIAELTFYAINQKVVVFEEFDQGGVFSSHAFVPKKRVEKTTSFVLPASALHRLSFLSNTYALHVALPHFDQTERVHCCEVLKIVTISPENPNYARVCDVTVVAHLRGKKLAVLRLSKMEWETDFCNSTFEDVVNHQGKLHAVDKWGRAFVMDRDSLRVTKVASALANYDAELKLKGGRKLRLISVSGGLYLVINDPGKIGFNIYKLSLGVRKWVEVEDEDREWGDQVIVMGLYCNFGVARDLLFASKFGVARFCARPEFVFAPLEVVGSYDKDEPYTMVSSRQVLRDELWREQHHQLPFC